MKKGTRVRFNRLGEANFPDLACRVATVVGVLRTPDCLRILFDGYKTPQNWHIDFLRKVRG